MAPSLAVALDSSRAEVTRLPFLFFFLFVVAVLFLSADEGLLMTGRVLLDSLAGRLAVLRPVRVFAGALVDSGGRLVGSAAGGGDVGEAAPDSNPEILKVWVVVVSVSTSAAACGSLSLRSVLGNCRAGTAALVVAG